MLGRVGKYLENHKLGGHNKLGWVKSLMKKFVPKFCMNLKEERIRAMWENIKESFSHKEIHLGKVEFLYSMNTITKNFRSLLQRIIDRTTDGEASASVWLAKHYPHGVEITQVPLSPFYFRPRLSQDEIYSKNHCR